MKTIINVLVATIASLVFIGCSSVSPVSSSHEDDLSVVSGTVTIARLGVLAKTAASNYPDAPTMILFTTSPVRTGHLVDTMHLSGPGPSYSFSLLGFEKDKDYTISAAAVSADYGKFDANGNVLGMTYNIGTASVSIGSNAEVSVNIAMRAIAHKIKVSIPIKGTPSALSACGVKMILSSSDLASGVTYRDTIKTTFAVVSMDTVKLDRIMPLNSLRTSESTTYNVEIVIDNADGSCYKGNSNIALSPSSTSSATITLTKYGDLSALAKMTITLSPLGEVLVTVSYL